MAKILIVDDNEDYLTVLYTRLKSKYEVVMTAVVSEAKKIIDNNGLDLMIQDLRMPDESAGVKLLEYSKNKKPKMPVIVISSVFNKAGTDYPDIERMADALILKPVSKEIFQTIDSLLNGSSTKSTLS